MSDEELVQINVKTGNRVFFYRGYIISEDDHFITFNDNKFGEIRISKNTIELIRYISEGSK